MACLYLSVVFADRSAMCLFRIRWNHSCAAHRPGFCTFSCCLWTYIYVCVCVCNVRSACPLAVVYILVDNMQRMVVLACSAVVYVCPSLTIIIIMGNL